ncbi:6306_t:CDS:2 [Entrophospora sp. SA101]|nr:6306_t:CDS:2 [Entrophospora sp. SA101]
MSESNKKRKQNQGKKLFQSSSYPRLHSYFQFSAAPYHGHDSYAAFDGLYLKDSHCHFDNKKHVKTLNLKKKNVSSLVLEECEVYQIIKRA